MSHKPPLSILIPWYERDELRLTLAANAPGFRAHDAEILVLNCGGNSQRLRGLIAASGVAGVRQLDISVPRFNKSLALNAGLAHAGSDTIFVLDADVVLLSQLPVGLMDGRSFITTEWVYESAPLNVNPTLSDSAVTSAIIPTLQFNFRNGAKVTYQLSRQDPFRNRRSGPGLLLANKGDLLDIHGYNADLESWGWEDDDVLVRLQYVLGRERVQSGAALHLTHDDDRRVLRGSRSQSDHRNFIKCCRNYNNGSLLGTYRADMVSLADKLAEIVVDVASPKPPPAIAWCGPSFLSGPIYCGSENGMCEGGRDPRKQPPSIGELLLEAALDKCPLENRDILHVGIGASRLATQLASRCRHITGVARNASERSTAVNLGLPNYRIVVCNKYSEAFRTQLPLSAYDVIIDNDMASHACCQRHLRALLETYSSLLAPSGWLATAEQGLEGPPSGDSWNVSDADLACLAGQFSLCVTKADCGIYSLKRPSGNAL